MSSPYTNDTRRKQCVECEEWFSGDETVKGEVCPACLDTAEDCPQCGETLYNGKSCTKCEIAEARGITW